MSLLFCFSVSWLISWTSTLSLDRRQTAVQSPSPWSLSKWFCWIARWQKIEHLWSHWQQRNQDLPDTDDTWLGLFDSSPDPHIRVSCWEDFFFFFNIFRWAGDRLGEADFLAVFFYVYLSPHHLSRQPTRQVPQPTRCPWAPTTRRRLPAPTLSGSRTTQSLTRVSPFRCFYISCQKLSKKYHFLDLVGITH